MTLERTLGIIKPNAIGDNNIGNIISFYEKNELKIAALKMLHLSKEKAEGFYIEHKERPFFGSLVSFMTSSPVVLVVLEGQNAVAKNRELMGSTNPEEANEGTLRKMYAKNIEANAVHGSSEISAAEREISYFFDPNEVFERN